MILITGISHKHPVKTEQCVVGHLPSKGKLSTKECCLTDEMLWLLIHTWHRPL